MVFKPVKQRFQFVAKGGREAHAVARQIARFAGEPKIYNELIWRSEAQ